MPIGTKPADEKTNFKEPTLDECLALIGMPETLTSINSRIGRLIELAEQDAERRAKADAQIEEWKAMFKKLSEPLNYPYHGMFDEEPGKEN